MGAGSSYSRGLRLAPAVFLVPFIAQRDGDMVIQFNAYSTMDLMGILVALPLAVNFYIRYFLMRHRRPELLFANMLAIMGGICVIMMLQDNVAKAGQPTATMTSGAQTTLRLYRWMYAVTFVTAFFWRSSARTGA